MLASNNVIYKLLKHSHIHSERLRQLIAENKVAIEARLNVANQRMGREPRASGKALPTVLIKNKPMRWTAVYEPLIRLYALFPALLALMSDPEFLATWTRYHRNQQVPFRAEMEIFIAQVLEPLYSLAPLFTAMQSEQPDVTIGRVCMSFVNTARQISQPPATGIFKNIFRSQSNSSAASPARVQLSILLADSFLDRLLAPAEVQQVRPVLLLLRARIL